MASEGDDDWIRAALERHREPLLRFAASLVGPSHAPDVVQDTFVALCKADRNEVQERLPAWLFRVCKNRAVDLLRERERCQSMTDDEDTACAESGPASSLERKQSLSRVQSLLLELPERQQEVLLLKFSAGLSYKEIAEAMDLTVGNVGFILHTAIQSVRGRLASAVEPIDERSVP